MELAPIVQDIFNASLSEGDLLDLLKVSNIYPVPNISPPQQIEKDLRPIALTCTLAKVMEGFVRDRIVAKVSSAIDPHQFARAGHSTTDALVYLLQAICEALHIWNCGGRLFYADFSKGFDMIDHEILISELRYLSVHPVLINCHDSYNLLRSWRLRIKFVDDTTALEIIPRNSTSLLSFAANNIHRFSVDHRMKLNLVKCKDTLINFMHNHNFILNSIVLGNNTIENVNTYKLLGVHISSDLKLNCHVEYITRKTNKRLYSIGILKHNGAPQIQLVKVYVSLIRPILEYAVPAWQNIPDHLQEKIEKVQKRALRIIFLMQALLRPCKGRA